MCSELQDVTVSMFLRELRPPRPKWFAIFTPTHVTFPSSRWANWTPPPLGDLGDPNPPRGVSMPFYIHNTARGEALSSEWFTNTSASLTPRWCMKLALSSISICWASAHPSLQSAFSCWSLITSKAPNDYYNTMFHFFVAQSNVSAFTSHWCCTSGWCGGFPAKALQDRHKKFFEGKWWRRGWRGGGKGLHKVRMLNQRLWELLACSSWQIHSRSPLSRQTEK